MKYTYFCQHHVDRMARCEGLAINSWIDMMRRGAQSYAACRTEAARNFLGAALEIGLLRYTCESNENFNDMHIAKPLEFLMELMICENNFNESIVLLSTISTVIYQDADKAPESLIEFLASCYEKIESSEKKYFLETQSAPLEKNASLATSVTSTAAAYH